jgi:hypothetical protein
MRVRIGISAVVLTAATTVAACSANGDEPATLPDATSAASAASPTEGSAATPTGDPTAELEAEISEFYELYVETINESWTSEEALQRRREMFADSCTSCLQGYKFAQRAQREGLILEAKPGTIHEVRLDSLDGDVATFLVHEDIPAGRLKDAGGSVVQVFGATEGAQVIFRAQRIAPDQWVIIASDVLSVEGGG